MKGVWILHDGKKQPLKAGVKVKMQIRCVDRSHAENSQPIAVEKLTWPHNGGPGDIIWFMEV